MADDSMADQETAKKDHSSIDLEIRRRVAELNRYVENVEQKIRTLIRENAGKREEELEAGIEALKRNQADLKKGLNGSMIEFCRSNDSDDLNLGVFTNVGLEQEVYKSMCESGGKGEEELGVLVAGIEGFKNEEDDVRKRLNELKLGFDHCSDDRGDLGLGIAANIEGLKQAKHRLVRWNEGSGKEIKGFKTEIVGFRTEQDYEKRKLIERWIEFGQSESGVLGVSTEGKEQEMYLSMHGNENSKEEFEGFEKEGDDGMKKLNEGQREFDQSDSFDLGVATNIEGLEQDMYELMREIKKSGERDDERFDEECQAHRVITDRAFALGSKLPCLLVDLVVLVSNKEEVATKLREFKSALGMLEEFIDDTRELKVVNLVKDKIVALLEELKDAKTASPPCDSRRNSRVMEEIAYEENQVNQLFNRLFEEIMHLEFILGTSDLPKSQVRKKEALSKMEDGLKQCEEELKELESKMNELRNNGLEDSEGVGAEKSTEKSKEE